MGLNAERRGETRRVVGKATGKKAWEACSDIDPGIWVDGENGMTIMGEVGKQQGTHFDTEANEPTYADVD